MNYVGCLEDEVQKLKKEVKEKGEKSAGQIQVEADRLRQNVIRGIQRLLVVSHISLFLIFFIVIFPFFSRPVCDV